MFAEESINLLQRSGLQFPRHEQVSPPSGFRARTAFGGGVCVCVRARAPPPDPEAWNEPTPLGRGEGGALAHCGNQARSRIPACLRSVCARAQHINATSQEGIDVNDFAERLMTSGLILSPDTYWITFHSGYDFGYLMRLLTCQDIPEQERDFFELLRLVCRNGAWVPFASPQPPGHRQGPPCVQRMKEKSQLAS